MQRLFVRGLVRLANHVRGGLAEPLTEEQGQRLRGDVVRAIATVEELLRKNQLATRDLPAPTRKAYEYLRSLDLRAIKWSTAASEDKYRNGSVRFKGLGSYFDRLLDALALQTDPIKIDEAFASICRTTDDLHQHATDHSIAKDDLTPDSRDMLAWLSYFRERSHLDAYVRAVLLQSEMEFPAVLVSVDPNGGKRHEQHEGTATFHRPGEGGDFAAAPARQGAGVGLV